MQVCARCLDLCILEETEFKMSILGGLYQVPDRPDPCRQSRKRPRRQPSHEGFVCLQSILDRLVRACYLRGPRGIPDHYVEEEPQSGIHVG